MEYVKPEIKIVEIDTEDIMVLSVQGAVDVTVDGDVDDIWGYKK